MPGSIVIGGFGAGPLVTGGLGGSSGVFPQMICAPPIPILPVYIRRRRRLAGGPIDPTIPTYLTGVVSDWIDPDPFESTVTEI